MDRALDMVIKAQGNGTKTEMSKFMLHMLSLNVLSMIRRHTSSILTSIENTKCVEALTGLVKNIATKSPSLWAIRMLDSSAKAPQGLVAGGWALLGDYEECVRTHGPHDSFQGRFCLLSACVGGGGDPASCPADPRDAPSWQRFARGETWPPPAMDGLPLQLGVCVPSSCTAADLQALATRALSSAAGHNLRVSVTPDACSLLHGDTPWGAADLLALLILFGLGVLVTACTMYDKRTKESGRGRWALALSFSLVQNRARLVSTEAPPASQPQLPAVHGLRILALFWTALHTSLSVASRIPLANGQHFLQGLDTLGGTLANAGFLGLDTLLLLSGATTALAFLRRSSAAPQGRSAGLAAYYLRRVARFLPSLVFVLILDSSLILKTRKGPMWHLNPGYKCSDQWPLIVLNICNYFRPESVQCLENAWFLSLEWQLFAAAPLLLWGLRRRGRRTLEAMAALGAAGLFLRFWLAYGNALDAPWGSTYSKKAAEMLYFPTHARFVPYLMGLALGYAVHRMKTVDKPARLAMRQATALHLAWPLLLLGALLSVARLGDRSAPPPPALAALLLALLHALWALGVALYVYLAAAGYAVPGVGCLSHGCWQPLSRLVFGAFLLLTPSLETNAFDARNALHFSVWRQIGAAVLNLMASLICAAGMWLTIQGPMENLAALLGSTPQDERKNPQQNGSPSGEKAKYVRIPCDDLEDMKIAMK